LYIIFSYTVTQLFKISLGLNEYYSGDQIEKNEMNGACDMCGGQERCIQGLVETPEGKRPLGRPGRRCEDNIKMDLHEVGWGEGMA
jgi:hypothetical protein